MHVHTNIPYSLTMPSILLINNNILVTTYLSTNCHYLSLYSILMCFCWGEHPLHSVLEVWSDLRYRREHAHLCIISPRCQGHSPSIPNLMLRPTETACHCLIEDQFSYAVSLLPVYD